VTQNYPSLEIAATTPTRSVCRFGFVQVPLPAVKFCGPAKLTHKRANRRYEQLYRVWSRKTAQNLISSSKPLARRTPAGA
jgi:hypothetical protein